MSTKQAGGQTTVPRGRRARRGQGGFSFVELIIVIAVIMIMIGGVFAAKNKLFASNKAQIETRRATQIAADITSYYQGLGRNSYAGIANQVAIDNGLVPQEMVSGADLLNSWAGTVTIAPTNLGAGVNNAVQLTYTNVPREECTKMVAGTAQNAAQVQVNGQVVKAFGAAVAVDPAVLGQRCNDPTANVIDLSFL